MNDNKAAIYNQVLDKIHFSDLSFNFESLDHKDKYQTTFNFIKDIVSSVGCHDYMFILLITKLEERYGKSITPILWEIVDNYYHYQDLFSMDIAFGAFYNLALHYYRQNDCNKLKYLISSRPYYSLFYLQYPLVYEAIARYCNIRHLYDRQMLMAQCAVKELEKIKKLPIEKRRLSSGYIQTGENVATKVSYASAYCLMLDHCYKRGKLFTNQTKTNVDNNYQLSDITIDSIDSIVNPVDNVEYNIRKSDNDFAIALQYINDAIDYNKDYPKYYYLKAKVMFYKSICLEETLDIDKVTMILNLLDIAKSKENPLANDYEARCSKYDSFMNTVQEWNTQKLNNNDDLCFEKMKDEIIQALECPPQQDRPQTNITSEDDEYVFISYSTKDFKPVYCDIIEMQKRRIQYWYDVGTIPGQRWDEVIEEKIKNASCIICYLSPSFLTSKAILKELQFIEKHNKPILCIDLTNKKQIAKVLIDVIKNGNDDNLKAISSDVFQIFTRLFNDDIDVIARDLDPSVINHMNRIEKVIRSKYEKVIHNVITTSASWQNNRKYPVYPTLIKPMEDYLIASSNVFIVVDGISRTSEEYSLHQGSIAYDVSRIFSDEIYDLINTKIGVCRNRSMVEELIRQSFVKANEKVGNYLDQNKDRWLDREKPGCVGIVAVLYNQTLCFGTIGDCMGIMYRNGQPIVFADKQTTYPFDKLNIEEDRKLLMKEYVNNPNNLYGYGVINGDKNAISFFRVSHISLEHRDIVYLASDGISDYIQYTNPNFVINKDLCELYQLSLEQDNILNRYADDKAIIKIFIE